MIVFPSLDAPCNIVFWMKTSPSKTLWPTLSSQFEALQNKTKQKKTKQMGNKPQLTNKRKPVMSGLVILKKKKKINYRGYKAKKIKYIAQSGSEYTDVLLRSGEVILHQSVCTNNWKANQTGRAKSPIQRVALCGCLKPRLQSISSMWTVMKILILSIVFVKNTYGMLLLMSGDFSVSGIPDMNHQ